MSISSIDFNEAYTHPCNLENIHYKSMICSFVWLCYFGQSALTRKDTIPFSNHKQICSQVACKNNFHSSLRTGSQRARTEREPPRSLRAPNSSFSRLSARFACECFLRLRRGQVCRLLTLNASPFGMYSST